MRTAAVVLVIIGTIASIALGVKWISDFETYETEIASVEEFKNDPDVAQALKEMQAVRSCAYALIVCGIIATVTVLLAGKIGKLAAGIILACAIVPAIFSPISLVFTFFFLIGGLLLFFAKPKVPTKTAA
ncbi:hypothetical protein U6B65_05810 [Oscillospiraceae bacterium MB08-C2-2]|nr:hypothetical protein U6B65_05810 [Oscillospiraceae bacterium MB08-C2-2]